LTGRRFRCVTITKGGLAGKKNQIEGEDVNTAPSISLSIGHPSNKKAEEKLG